MFIDNGCEHNLRSSGARCFRQSYAKSAHVSLRWSDEKFIGFGHSINVSYLRHEETGAKRFNQILETLVRAARGQEEGLPALFSWIAAIIFSKT
jgi:hypothetical protein